MDRNKNLELSNCGAVFEGWEAVSKVGLDCRECQLDGVEIWRVWR